MSHNPTLPSLGVNPLLLDGDNMRIIRVYFLYPSICHASPICVLLSLEVSYSLNRTWCMIRRLPGSLPPMTSFMNSVCPSLNEALSLWIYLLRRGEGARVCFLWHILNCRGIAPLIWANIHQKVAIDDWYWERLRCSVHRSTERTRQN